MPYGPLALSSSVKESTIYPLRLGVLLLLFSLLMCSLCIYSFQVGLETIFSRQCLICDRLLKKSVEWWTKFHEPIWSKQLPQIFFCNTTLNLNNMDKNVFKNILYPCESILGLHMVLCRTTGVWVETRVNVNRPILLRVYSWRKFVTINIV